MSLVVLPPRPSSGRRLRPDPRTALIVVFALNACAISSPSLAGAGVAAVVGLAALVLAGWCRWAAYVAAAELLFLGLAFVPWPASVVTGLVSVACYWFFRISVAAGAGLWALAVIRPGELTAGLRRARVPVWLVVPLAVMIRFVPVAAGEVRATREAIAQRGLRGGPVVTLERWLVPLFSSVTRIADEMSAAGMTRGLGSQVRPSSVQDIGFRAVDWAWLVVCVVMAVMAWQL